MSDDELVWSVEETDKAAVLAVRGDLARRSTVALHEVLRKLPPRAAGRGGAERPVGRHATR